MTDLIMCPECHGHGEHVLGELRFLCELCHGTGEVGGDNEPAERDDEVREFNPYTDASPLWEEIRAHSSACPTCFGTGEVVNVGDIRSPSKLVMGPCPTCTRART